MNAIIHAPLDFSASGSFLLALPLSPVWSIRCFKPSYGEISSYSHFCLSITSYVEREHPRPFLLDAVLSCPFLLKLHLCRHLAQYFVSPHTQSYMTLMRNSS